MAAPHPSSSSAPQQQNGVYIGKFRRLESIGKGSFAIVYKAVHPVDQSLVAIKTVQHASLKGKLKQNLFSEIDILKKTHHPHIVALINILESTNHIHLVMEFCQLGDLATFIKKKDRLAAHPVTADMVRKYPNPPDAGFNEVVVRHYAKQLAAALKFMRDKDLVHRDLKPQNLLLNPPPSYIAAEPPESRPYQVAKNSLIPETGIESLPQLKIADFGFARHLPSTTMAETLCGSPLYMAPEILSYQKYDAKADLWSVGTVLFELMVGKPPFRAANHVDLLRKIEKTQDQIKFPNGLVMSSDMMSLICGLLKKSPIERMGWNDFFASPVNTDPIPGLVGEDRKAASAPQINTNVSNIPEEDPQRDSLRASPRRDELREAAIAMDRRRSSDQTARLTPPTTASPLQRKYSSGSPRAERPSITTHATTTAVPTRVARPLPTQAMSERRRSHNLASPGTSVPKTLAEPDRAVPRQQDRAARELREKAAQDVAFERDYVVVEKRAVEVNAFADELAASPQIHGTREQAGAMMRRATTQGLQSTPSQPLRTPQAGSRPESGHQRNASYERRYGPQRGSAQSAIAAALNMVNWRLHGVALPQSLGKSSSPPQPYGPFPAFPAMQASPLMLMDSPKTGTLDEDSRVLNAIEESATRSDVVYGFAEVKYKQLIPISPSNENALGIRHPSGMNGAEADDEDLTADAMVAISEEALVLYVKSLAILTNTINAAGYWWSQKNRHDAGGDAPPSPSGGKSNLGNVGIRVNHVVQWARNRFNECLEKSEYVSRRLVEAQKKLPQDHPGHPSNHPREMEMQHKDMSGSQIHLSSGVTAEKLMYDRALDMSKTAAVNELVGEDLQGCEVSYLTAVRLLEAVLEKTDDTLRDRSSGRREKSRKASRESLDGDNIDENDKDTVLKLIEGNKRRLTALRKKTRAQSMQRRGSYSKASPELQQAVQVSTSAPSGENRLSQR